MCLTTAPPVGIARSAEGTRNREESTIDENDTRIDGDLPADVTAPTPVTPVDLGPAPGLGVWGIAAVIDVVTSVRRNWIFSRGAIIHVFLWVPILGLIVAIPVALAGFALGLAELFLLLTDAEGRRMGDKMAKTRVVMTG
ncbi:MAG: hypothetical protein BMS9Abin29_0995 [Gemmatimonadota bacterium]|nr:MAG: hypothetical protein BMS9Abin29_0995 [Gemmatimonadota bacterium]